MPWIKKDHLFIYVALLLILIMAIRTPLDSDMWWHLRAGEETWTSQDIYTVDTFSHTRSGSEWINHSWLSQVIMYLLYRQGGFYALSILVGLCAVVSMAFVYLQMDGYALIKSSILLLAGIVASVVWSPRPQIFSLVLFALVAFLLYKYKSGKTIHILWWFLPIMLFWANLHAGYSLGFILIGSVIVGEIFDKLLAREQKSQLSLREIGLLAISGIVCLLVILINPFGTDIWKIPFNTVGLETLQDYISEWASPDFHQSFQQPLLILLIGTMVTLGLSKTPLSGMDLVTLSVFSFAALVARRNFGPFAIIAAPILSKQLSAFFDQWKDMIKTGSSKLKGLLDSVEGANQDFRPGIINAVNTILMVLLITAVAWKTIDVNDPTFVQRAEAEMFPRDAVDWLKESQLSGNLYNDYNWGGYLIWSLPDYPVFSDGRTDLFGDTILTDYLHISSGSKGWNDVLDSYEIEILLIRPDSALEELATLASWKVVYKDPVAVILTR